MTRELRVGEGFASRPHPVATAHRLWRRPVARSAQHGSGPSQLRGPADVAEDGGRPAHIQWTGFRQGGAPNRLSRGSHTPAGRSRRAGEGAGCPIGGVGRRCVVPVGRFRGCWGRRTHHGRCPVCLRAWSGVGGLRGGHGSSRVGRPQAAARLGPARGPLGPAEAQRCRTPVARGVRRRWRRPTPRAGVPHARRVTACGALCRGTGRSRITILRLGLFGGEEAGHTAGVGDRVADPRVEERLDGPTVVGADHDEVGTHFLGGVGMVARDHGGQGLGDGAVRRDARLAQFRDGLVQYGLASESSSRGTTAPSEGEAAEAADVQNADLGLGQPGHVTGQTQRGVACGLGSMATRMWWNMNVLTFPRGAQRRADAGTSRLRWMKPRRVACCSFMIGKKSHRM